MKECEWILGNDTVDAFYEYKNLGALKNYIGSFPLMSKITLIKSEESRDDLFI